MKSLNFWLIWLWGAGPLLIAIVLYTSQTVPLTSNERGQFVEPGRTLAELSITTPDNQPWQPERRWQLVLNADASCDHACQRWIEQLPNLVTALGKDQPRVRWHIVGPNRELATASSGHGIWIADPLGNLVLHYQFDQPAKDLLKDLKRLLKVSRIG